MVLGRQIGRILHGQSSSSVFLSQGVIWPASDPQLPGEEEQPAEGRCHAPEDPEEDISGCPGAGWCPLGLTFAADKHTIKANDSKSSIPLPDGTSLLVLGWLYRKHSFRLGHLFPPWSPMLISN